MLHENVQPAADRSRAEAADHRPSAERAADSRPGDDTRSDEAAPAESGPAPAKAAESKAAESKPAEEKSAEADADDVSAAETDATAETDAAAQTAAADKTEAGGEGKNTEAKSQTTESSGKPAKADASGIVDGKPADGTKTDAHIADSAGVTAAKSAPAAPTAVAHAGNAAHAADAAAGKAPPVAAAAMEAGGGKPADTQAKGGEKRAAPGLPTADGQPQAEDAPKNGGKNPVVPEHVEQPAQSHRNATADNAAPSLPNNAHAAAKAATDAAQPLNLTSAAHQLPPAQTLFSNAPAPQATAQQPAAVPLAGIAIEIAGKALAGKNRFEIRLDPPELGRIEVRLDVGRDGRVTSHLVADRADTLNLLQRDAATLQRALQDAGLKTGDDGLQFSLRDHATGQQQERTERGDSTRLVVEDEALPRPGTIASARATGRNGGIDIRV